MNNPNQPINNVGDRVPLLSNPQPQICPNVPVPQNVPQIQNPLPQPQIPKLPPFKRFTRHIFSLIGIVFSPFYTSILRIIASIVGAQTIKKKSSIRLILFYGMTINNLALTIFAPFDVNQFRDHDGEIMFLYFLLRVVFAICMFIVQVLCLKSSKSVYDEEKARRCGQPVENPMTTSTSSFITVQPQPPVNVVSEPVTVDSEIQRKDMYLEEKHLLREMGFNDDKRNDILLEKFKGDLQNVVQNYFHK